MAAKLFAAPLSLDARQLKTIAECPFKHFVKQAWRFHPAKMRMLAARISARFIIACSTICRGGDCPTAEDTGSTPLAISNT